MKIFKNERSYIQIWKRQLKDDIALVIYRTKQTEKNFFLRTGYNIIPWPLSCLCSSDLAGWSDPRIENLS
jgi:hypothetical protein